jgi:hypothetical protein
MLQGIVLNPEQASALRDLVARYVDTAADSVAGGGTLVTTPETVEAAGRRLLVASKIAQFLGQGGGRADPDVLDAFRENRTYLAECAEEAADNEQRERDRRQIETVDGLLAQLGEFCTCCGDHPAAYRSIGTDEGGYCELCVAKMIAEDAGVVHYAVQVMAHAMATIYHYVGEPAEVTRMVDEVLRISVLDPRNEPVELDTADTPAHSIRPQFVPISEAVTA